MDDFTLAGDSGAAQTIADGNTLTIAGGTGIDTVAGATDTVTVAIDSTVATLTGAQTLTNKTLTAPTIADFTNAAHDHTDADDGGTLPASAIGSGTVATARLGSGTADNTTYLRGDQTWATPAGGSGVDPLTTVDLVDEFAASGVTSGTVGELGWSFSAGSAGVQDAEPSHPGVIRRTSSANSGQLATLSHRSAGNVVSMDDDWTLDFILRPTLVNSTVRYLFGMADGIGSVPPTNGCYIEKLVGDTNWFFVTRAASTETRADSGVAAAAATWVRFRIRLSGTTVYFSIDGGSETSQATNVPATSVEVQPAIILIPAEAVAKTLDLDYARLQITGLSR
jgi:hypothetical protein